MHGNDSVISQLNVRLTEELTAISQYIVHAEMCKNWHYRKLHDVIFKRSIEEMKHAEKLIARILALKGVPRIEQISTIAIGSEIQKIHLHDHAVEAAAINGYNESIRLALVVGDTVTRELLEAILVDEEEHIDCIEAQMDQIAETGMQNYLRDQLR